MTLPAARMADQTVHGGMVTTGAPTVLIGSKPAARTSDMHVCPMVTGPVPHVGGPIVIGSLTVLVAGMMQARVSDTAICVGPPDAIAVGEPTVLVGTGGAGGGLGGLIGALAGALAAAVKAFTAPHPRAVIQPDGSYNTEYSENIRFEGTAEQQARNVQQFDAIRKGDGGEELIAAIGSQPPPVTLNVIGDPARAGELHPGQQSHENCAVQSSQQIIRQATGKNYSEAEMEQIAVNPNNSGYTRNGGTPIGGEEVILDNGGVPAHMESGTPANVDAALANGQGVVSGHDAGALWNDPNYAAGGHAVQTTGAIQDSKGNTIGYVINDTGTNQAGRVMPATDYRNSMDGGDIAVTDNPIW